MSQTDVLLMGMWIERVLRRRARRTYIDKTNDVLKLAGIRSDKNKKSCIKRVVDIRISYLVRG